MARAAYKILMVLFLAGVVVQFFLAGLGMPEFGNEGFDTHETFGRVLEVFVIVLLVLSVVAKLGRVTIGSTAVLTLLVVLQSMWVSLDDPKWIGALHVLGAAAILLGVSALVRRSMHMASPE